MHAASDPPARPCPVCGSTRSRTCARIDNHPLLRCDACRFRWTPPPDPADLEQIYTASYYEGGENTSVYHHGYNADRARAQNHARILDGLEQLGARGRLLDVGCAYGFFLDSARARGWNVHGVDLSAHAVSLARARLGPCVWLGTVEALPAGAGPFDAVTLLDTLEHLPDPVAVLTAIHRHLRPGGILFIRTVDGESLAARWLGTRWPQVKPPEHLVYPAPRHLATWLRRTGFAPARIEWNGGLGLGWRAVRTSAPLPPAAGRPAPRIRRRLKAVIDRLLAVCRATDMVHVYARCGNRTEPGP
jgi:2-polyprenyl-3-methyl-5-hydroxy-6-metoxy-1,4-benzoquinol methylase